MKLADLFVELNSDTSGLEGMSREVSDEMDEVKRQLGRVNAAVTSTAGTMLGLAGAATAVGAATGAAAASAAGGFATIGIIASATKEDVQQTFKGLGQQISSTFQGISGPIDDALTHVARVASGLLGVLEDDFADAFETVAPYIETAANTLSQFAQTVMPAAVRITKAAAPVVDAVARGFDALGQGLVGFLDGLGQGMSGAATTVEALFGALGRLLPVLGDVMGSISQAAETLGPAFADAFTELTTVVLRFLEGVIVPLAPHIATVVEEFTSFMQAIRKSIGPVAAFTGVLTPILGALATMGGIVSPVVAGVTALAGAALTLYNNWNRVVDVLKRNKTAAVALGGALAGTLPVAMSSIASVITSSVIPAITSATAGVWSFVAAAAPWAAAAGAIAGTAYLIYDNWSGITSFFSRLWQGVKNIIWGAKEAIVGTFDKMWTKVQQRFVVAAKNLLDPLGDIAEALGATGIADSIEGLQDSLKNMVPAGAMNKAEARVTKGVEAMRQEVIDGAEAMRAGLGSALDAGGELLGKAKGLGSDLGSMLKGGFDSAMGGGLMKGAFGGGGTGAPKSDVAATKVEQLRGSVSAAKGLAKELGGAMEGAALTMQETRVKMSASAKAMAQEVSAGWKQMARRTGIAIDKLKKMGPSAVASMVETKERMESMAEQIGRTVERGFEKAAAGMLKGIGKMAAGQATLAGVAGNVLSTLANLAIRVGKIAIATGAAIEGIKKALESLNPVAAFAAGAALIIVGAAAKSALSNAASSAGRAQGSRAGGASVGGGVADVQPSQSVQYTSSSRADSGAMGGVKKEMSQMREEQEKTNERLAQTNERLGSVESATREGKAVREGESRQQLRRARNEQAAADPATPDKI